jgi:choline dehydrogenase
VLLLEAGGTDDVPAVREAQRSLSNLGSERDWKFQAMPNPLLNGRRLSLSMGKVLGGGSSINAMVWSRGHKDDWDYFADEAGDSGWNYESVLGIYRRIEDWQGTPDALRRGKGGLVYVEPARDPNPIAPAMLDAARSLGIPTFDDQNGEMMEGEGGAAIVNVRIRAGRRLSVFRTYTYPYIDRHNLTVLTGALVTRIVLDGKRAIGVEFRRNGHSHQIAGRCEIVLSLGAINTPKVLMQSGIGDESELAPCRHRCRAASSRRRTTPPSRPIAISERRCLRRGEARVQDLWRPYERRFPMVGPRVRIRLPPAVRQQRTEEAVAGDCGPTLAQMPSDLRSVIRR